MISLEEVEGKILAFPEKFKGTPGSPTCEQMREFLNEFIAFFKTFSPNDKVLDTIHILQAFLHAMKRTSLKGTFGSFSKEKFLFLLRHLSEICNREIADNIEEMLETYRKDGTYQVLEAIDRVLSPS